MRIRGKQEVTDLEELKAADELRETLNSLDTGAPSQAYWPRMIAEINRRIDDATSGKALSLSWAARVAIPGVVAIISFYIGLHYYVPEDAPKKTPIAPIISSLPQSEIDSLLLNEPAESAAHLFSRSFSSEDAAQYALSSGEPMMLVESFSNEQVELLLAALSTGRNVSL